MRSSVRCWLQVMFGRWGVMATKAKTSAKAKTEMGAKPVGKRRPAKVSAAHRPSRETVEEEVLATAHGLAAALRRVGAIDATTMREIDTLCLPPRPNYGSAEVRRIRAAARMSQPVFARLLGVDKSA